MKIENDMDTQNMTAWLNGAYVAEAIAANFSKQHHSYPKEPKDLHTHHNEELEAPPGDSMSDGQRFYLFMLEHNKALAKKRGKK